MAQNHHSPPLSAVTDRNLHSPARTTRRNSNAVEEINDEYANSSPYYRGLTNFSKLQPVSNPNGERKSAGSVTSSSSSHTSYIVKIQNWSSSCFIFTKKSQVFVRSGPNSGSEIANVANVVQDRKPLMEKVTLLLSKSPNLPPEVLPESPPAPSPRYQSPEKAVMLNAKEKNESENERKFVWADKYRPDALKDFICNRNKAIELLDMAKGDECRDLIFEGPPGVGKRTMIWALLREAFGPENIQTREECKEFGLKGEAVSSIHVNVKESDQHVEVNIGELKGYEKQVLFELIKETNTRLAKKSINCTHDNCRAIILYEADKLSSDALVHIRWHIERYTGCNKVFFCCNDISKLHCIMPLCTIVQLSPPSNQEIVEVLKFIAKEEGIELPYSIAEKIAISSNNNLRQAIRSFEATWLSNLSLKEDQAILTGWEDDISKLAKQIVQEQSPKQLYTTRGKLQKLIQHNVSPQFIIKTLVDEIKKNVEERLHHRIDAFYEEHNRRDEDIQKQFASKFNIDPRNENVKDFMKIEEFIARFMSCYKNCFAYNKCNVVEAIHYKKQ